MLRNYVLYLCLRAASLLIPFVPVRLAYRAADLAGGLAYALLGAPRSAVQSNLAQVMGRSPADDVVRSCARRVFQHDARNWVDTLRISRLDPDQILASVEEVEGWHHVEDAVARGRGLVLVGLHLGNFDLVGQVLAIRGYRVTVPVEHMQPEGLYHFLLGPRTSKGINAVPIDRAARELVRALRGGEIAGVVGDRNLAGRGVAVDFFGRKAVLPRSAISLARQTQAPLVVAVGVRLPNGRFRGFVSPPIPMERSRDQEADARINAERLVSTMEGFIARFPDQWIVFSPVWADNDETQPVTIGRQSEAAV